MKVIVIFYSFPLIGGDADDADKAVTAVPSADVNPSEDVGGSDKNVKDVEKPKGDESRLKGDDFFDGLSQLVIDDDQVVLAGLEAVAKINVPAPNPDVVGEKSDALHTDEETEDTVSDTPLLDKRKRAPALKSPFVDFGSADVGSTPMELMSSGSQSAGDDRDFKMVTYVKGLYALNDAFADPVSTEIEAKFDSWIAAFSAIPLTLYIPPPRNLNLFVETMEDALRESRPYTDILFPRARRVWSWILSWVLCGPRRRTR
ncbi:hypothetical protein G4B88_014015 [Cannabis sativa]|uniref:Uncharacterized protein n=1 Tax=Cannabis sativa TaxID=3483 RepID=A0A7J6I0V7_CANSA|nr:hypothetical protein G4B88_014015 [Cannabis sativa]